MAHYFPLLEGADNVAGPGAHQASGEDLRANLLTLTTPPQSECITRRTRPRQQPTHFDNLIEFVL